MENLIKIGSVNITDKQDAHLIVQSLVNLGFYVCRNNEGQYWVFKSKL